MNTRETRRVASATPTSGARRLATFALYLFGFLAVLYWIFFAINRMESNAPHTHHAEILAKACLSGDTGTVYKYVDPIERQGGLSRGDVSALLRWFEECLEGWERMDRPGDGEQGIDIGTFTLYLENDNRQFVPFRVAVMESHEGASTDSIVQVLVRLGVTCKYLNEPLPYEIDKHHDLYRNFVVAHGIKSEAATLQKMGIDMIYSRQSPPIGIYDYGLHLERRALNMLAEYPQ